MTTTRASTSSPWVLWFGYRTERHVTSPDLQIKEEEESQGPVDAVTYGGYYMKIISFSQQGPRAICILSTNGVIFNVKSRQHDSLGGTVTYEAECRRKLGLPAEVPAASKPSAPWPVEEKKEHDVTSKVSAQDLNMEPAAGDERMFGAFFNQTGTGALSSMVNMLVDVL